MVNLMVDGSDDEFENFDFMSLFVTGITGNWRGIIIQMAVCMITVFLQLSE
jgi:hypothetical protein